jgi:lysophospholipase L1-like esterase
MVVRWRGVWCTSVMLVGCLQSRSAAPPQPPALTSPPQAAAVTVAPAADERRFDGTPKRVTLRTLPSPLRQLGDELRAKHAIERSWPFSDGKPPRHNLRVLQVGDSTVGGHGGLQKALGARFRRTGALFHSESWTSASIASVALSSKLDDALQAHRPDVVFLTLGANDVYATHAESLASYVRTIAARASRRHQCIWIGPALWRKDKGLVEVIRRNAAPCVFVDSSHLPIERGPDGIHPTNDGGRVWAAHVWFELWPLDSDDPALFFPAHEAPR